MTQEQLGEQMSSWEYAHHVADELEHPTGPEVLDMQFSRLVSMWLNAHRGRGATPIKITDCLLYRPRKPAVNRHEPTYEEVKAFAALFS